MIKVMEDMQSRVGKGVRITEIKREGEYRTPSQKITSTPIIKKRPSARMLRKPYFVLLLIIAILGSGYFIANKFEHAKVSVVAKRAPFTLDHSTFSASSNPDASVHFEIMIVDDSVEKDLTLSDTTTVSQKAHGAITIYNSFSSKPVLIAAHTFLSDPDGKAYLTDQALTIPGFTTVGTGITPGLATVPVTAFLTGDSYNGSPEDFTINAYKGTPKAQKVYGKLASPLSGGAEGNVYVLNSSDKGNLDAFAETEFKNNLQRKVNAEVPPGYILYPQAMTYAYTIDQGVLSKTSAAKIRVSGTMSAMIFNELDLNKALVGSILPSITKDESSEIELKDIQKLTFSFKDPTIAVAKNLSNADFTLTGQISALWHPDIDALRKNLLGINRNAASSVFKTDPGIAQAHASIFPPWQSTMPSDPGKIKIVVN